MEKLHRALVDELPRQRNNNVLRILIKKLSNTYKVNDVVIAYLKNRLRNPNRKQCKSIFSWSGFQ